MLCNVAAGVFDNAVDPDRTARFLAAPDHVIVVALAGDLVVGMGTGLVYYHPDKPPQFWINEVGTGDAWLRRGIARRVMQALLDEAQGRGCRYIWLGTEDDNRPARKLYRAMGGEETAGLVTFEWGQEG